MDASLSIRGQQECFLVTLAGDVACSSTNVRNALRASDADIVRAICPESVADYVLSHSSDLY